MSHFDDFSSLLHEYPGIAYNLCRDLGPKTLKMFARVVRYSWDKAKNSLRSTAFSPLLRLHSVHTGGEPNDPATEWGRVMLQREMAKAMRETGRMCQFCPRLLDVRAWQGGPQTCHRCARPQDVTLRFKFEYSVWWVQFLHPDTSLPVAPSIRFADAGKLRELICRTPTRWMLGERQAFEFGVANGDGRCALQLTSEQLQALKYRQGPIGARR